MIKKVGKFPELHPEEITEDDFDLSLTLFGDFTDYIVKREAGFGAIFLLLTNIVDALTRRGNSSIDELVSCIGRAATELQDTGGPKPKKTAKH